MILDYCRENKVAIRFYSKEELDRLVVQFCGTEYQENIPYKEGMVSFTRINASKNVTWNYRCSGLTFNNWYQEFIVITATEFFELADEQVSILELMG